MDRAHSAAHIEDGLPVDTAGAERLDEVAREAPWAVALVVAQLFGSMALVELASYGESSGVQQVTRQSLPRPVGI